MIDEDEVGLKEKPEDTRYIKKKDYIKIRPEAPGVRAKELDLNFCHYWDCGRHGAITLWLTKLQLQLEIYFKIL